MISITVVGRLVSPATKKTTKNNYEVYSYSLAVNHTGDRVTYLQCEGWGSIGRLIYDFVKKGDLVMVSGTLETNFFMKKDGGEGKSQIVKVDSVHLLPNKRNTQ